MLIYIFQLLKKICAFDNDFFIHKMIQANLLKSKLNDLIVGNKTDNGISVRCKQETVKELIIHLNYCMVYTRTQRERERERERERGEYKPSLTNMSYYRVWSSQR